MRYDDKKKAEVVAFVKNHNAKNGRGGQSAAKKKYGISAITIAKWLTDAGETLPGKGGAKKTTKAKPKGKGKGGRPKGKGGRPKGKGRAKAKKPAKKAAKRGRPKGSGKKSGGGRKAGASSLSARIQRLAEIDKEIQSLQQEFDTLKRSL